MRVCITICPNFDDLECLGIGLQWSELTLPPEHRGFLSFLPMSEGSAESSPGPALVCLSPSQLSLPHQSSGTHTPHQCWEVFSCKAEYSSAPEEMISYTCLTPSRAHVLPQLSAGQTMRGGEIQMLLLAEQASRCNTFGRLPKRISSFKLSFWTYFGFQVTKKLIFICWWFFFFYSCL